MNVHRRIGNADADFVERQLDCSRGCFFDTPEVFRFAPDTNDPVDGRRTQLDQHDRNTGIIQPAFDAFGGALQHLARPVNVGVVIDPYGDIGSARRVMTDVFNSGTGNGTVGDDDAAVVRCVQREMLLRWASSFEVRHYQRWRLPMRT